MTRLASDAPMRSDERARGIPFRHGLALSQLWMALVPLAVFGLVWSQSVSFVDLGYHLAAGEWQWEHQRWLGHDIFSWTVAGKEWINQNWLAQIVLYAAYRVGDLEGLVLLNAILFTAGFVLLLKVCLVRTGEIRTALLAAVVTAAPSFLNSGVRPQTFSWALLGLLIYLLVTGRDRPPRVLWAIPVMALWANLHGAFVVGLALMGAATAAALPPFTRHRKHPRLPHYVAASTVLAAVAALFNPWGWRVYSYAFEIASNETVRRSIAEWQPPGPMSWTGAMFLGSAIVVFASVAVSGRGSEPVELLWLGIGFALGLVAVRNGLWWTMASAPAFAASLRPLAEKLRASSIRESPTRHNLVVLGLVVALAAFVSPWARGSLAVLPRESRRLVSSETPTGAARFLQHHRLGGNMFNSQSFGSYLEWSVPQHPTFIDSRIELFPDAVWADYVKLMTLHPTWRDIVRERSIGFAVLKRDGGRARLAEGLERSPDWKEVYEGSGASVYVRQAGRDDLDR